VQSEFYFLQKIANVNSEQILPFHKMNFNVYYKHILPFFVLNFSNFLVTELTLFTWCLCYITSVAQFIPYN